MKVKKESLLLYAVTDRYWLNGRTLYSVVEEALEGGTTFLQLREKNLDSEHFLEEAKELQELCRKYGRGRDPRRTARYGGRRRQSTPRS